MTKDETLEEIKFNIIQILKERLPSSARVIIRQEISNLIDLYKDTNK